MKHQGQIWIDIMRTNWQRDLLLQEITKKFPTKSRKKGKKREQAD